MKEVKGRYVMPRMGFPEIRILADQLIAQEKNIGGFPTEDTPPDPPEPPFTLKLAETDRLVIVDGKYKDSTCDILRDAAGVMAWFRIAGRIHAKESIPRDA